MILADKRDYKNSYNKHYIAYQLLKKNNDSVRSRCLLLIYSVECGLKGLLLQKWKEGSAKPILDHEEDDRNKLIKSHDIKKILKALGRVDYEFPLFKTNHGDVVNTANYHQFCRYGIKARDRDEAKTKKYEEILSDIAEWIGEEI